MECHESQILNRDPALGPQHMKYLKRLVKMGLIIPGNFEKEGKSLLRFYITPIGISYLANLS